MQTVMILQTAMHLLLSC